jgi:streptogramin lyase
MSLSLNRQTLGVCLLSLIVSLVPFASQSAPILRNVTITSASENSQATLTGEIRSGGGGNMTIRVNWGDGNPIVVGTLTNTATNFVANHYYRDDNPTNTPADLYTISISVSNNAGVVSTNLGVPVFNVPPQLELSINSLIEIGAPATLRGLQIREFVVPTAGSDPNGIAVGPDGNIWFTETSANRLGRITTNGVITEFPLSGGQRPTGIASGPDARLWFCASGSQQIGAMTTNGAVTMYTIPRTPNEPFKTPQSITRRGGAMWYTDQSYRVSRITTVGDVIQNVFPAGVNPLGIAVGADNNIWFTAYFSDMVHRLRPGDGATNEYALEFLASPALMTRGPDDAVWFTESGSGDALAGKIGRITTNGVLTETIVGHTGPYGICTGPDGAIWFTERRFSSGKNSIGRLGMDGKLSRYGLAIYSDTSEIVAGPDGGLWFTMPGRDRIGRIRFTTAGNVVLSGELNDPGYLDTHTVQIDWGDGSAVETLNLAAGINSFHVAHTYSGAQPVYVINVTASDDDTGVDTASTVVMVNAMHLRSITRAQNGDVRITGTGGNGQTITIEGSTDLQSWSTVGTALSVSNNFQFLHPNAAGAIRFYRGKLP